MPSALTVAALDEGLRAATITDGSADDDDHNRVVALVLITVCGKTD
jgi:hypothetical protein